MTSGRQKTIGELIDSLFTTNMRCWVAQDKIMDERLSANARLQAAITAQQQNAKRSELIAAINDALGEKGFTATKTYTYFEDKE